MSQTTSLLIPEHFDKLVMMDHDQEKAEYLRSVANPAMKEMLRLVFDPSVVFDTPVPSYRPDDAPLGMSFNSLYTEYRRFYLFQETAKHINTIKKQSILAEILESIHATEAMFVERVIAKDLSDYELTEDLVRLAFPTLLPAKVESKEVLPVQTASLPKAKMSVAKKEKKEKKPRSKKSVVG